MFNNISKKNDKVCKRTLYQSTWLNSYIIFDDELAVLKRKFINDENSIDFDSFSDST